MSDLWESFEDFAKNFNDYDKLIAARWLLADVEANLEFDQSTDQRTALDMSMGAINLAMRARDRELDAE
jgi:hypothetical protein